MVLFAYILFFLVLICYGIASVAAWRDLLRETESKAATTPWLRNGGIIFHVLFLLVLGIKYGEFPLIDVTNLLTTVALSLVIVHTVVEVRSSIRGTGAFVLTMAALLHLISWPAVGLQPEEIKEVLKSPLFGTHVFFAVCGYTGFILSALYGVMYLIQFRALKSMRFGPLFKNLPALDYLSRLNIEAAFIGLVCLTVSILVGVLLATRLPEFSILDAKFIQALAAWFVYAILVAGRMKLDWGGRQLAMLSLACFTVFVGSAVILSTFFDSFHQFG